MQIHGPSGSFDEIPVHLNSGGFAVISFGTADVFAYSPGECDEIIRAAVLAKSMLLGETGEPVTELADPYGEDARDDAGRAIAADLGDQRTPLPRTFTCASPRCDWHSGRSWNPAESCPICGSAVWPYAERGGTDAS